MVTRKTLSSPPTNTAHVITTEGNPYVSIRRLSDLFTFQVVRSLETKKVFYAISAPTAVNITATLIRSFGEVLAVHLLMMQSKVTLQKFFNHLPILEDRIGFLIIQTRVNLTASAVKQMIADVPEIAYISSEACFTVIGAFEQLIPSAPQRKAFFLEHPKAFCLNGRLLSEFAQRSGIAERYIDRSDICWLEVSAFCGSRAVMSVAGIKESTNEKTATEIAEENAYIWIVAFFVSLEIKQGQASAWARSYNRRQGKYAQQRLRADIEDLLAHEWNEMLLKPILADSPAIIKGNLQSLKQTQHCFETTYEVTTADAITLLSAHPRLIQKTPLQIEKKLLIILGPNATTEDKRRVLLQATDALFLMDSTIRHRKLELEKRGISTIEHPQLLLIDPSNFLQKDLETQKGETICLPVPQSIEEAFDTAGWTKEDAEQHIALFPCCREVDRKTLSESLLQFRINLGFSGRPFTELLARAIPTFIGKQRQLAFRKAELYEKQNDCDPIHSDAVQRIVKSIHEIAGIADWSEPTREHLKETLFFVRMWDIDPKVLFAKFPELLSKQGWPIFVARQLETTYAIPKHRPPERSGTYGIRENLMENEPQLEGSRCMLFEDPQNIRETFKAQHQFATGAVHHSKILGLIDPRMHWIYYFTPISLIRERYKRISGLKKIDEANIRSLHQFSA